MGVGMLPALLTIQGKDTNRFGLIGAIIDAIALD